MIHKSRNTESSSYKREFTVLSWSRESIALIALLFIFLGVNIIYSLEQPDADSTAVAASVIKRAIVNWPMDDPRKELLGQTDNLTVTEGIWHKAVFFDGVRSYVQTGVSLNKTPDFSLAMWVKPGNINQKELSVILDNGHSSDKNCVVQTTDINSDKYAWRCSGHSVDVSLPKERWSYLVVVVSQSQKKILAFSNSQFKETELSGDINIDGTFLTLGRRTFSKQRYFRGWIDELMIWDQELSKIEITALQDYWCKRIQKVRKPYPC